MSNHFPRQQNNQTLVHNLSLVLSTIRSFLGDEGGEEKKSGD
jgi:hypothetical protein